MGKAIIIAVALALLIRHFLFEPYLVEGSSMYPTLHDGERLFVNKSVNYIGEIERGTSSLLTAIHRKSIM